ncbi:ADP-ribose pyrophosphatase YjhB (NUDIX family) [Roseospira marina]|nr:ADP-ribose pyrophosphatase YjhB (NUDIX family) [Roseospira marina]MBB5089111.1 ADP-ribose pyrophosphatase YjhB (NUDIX family) [Roseospira marina]
MSVDRIHKTYFMPVPGGARGAGPTVAMVPDGDDRERLVCTDCGYVRYDNPKIIVGAVCTWEDRYLLVRRAIPPREGHWCLPSGFMELGESTEAGATREVWEEACARVAVTDLLALYNLAHISQVHLIYRARMLTPDCAPGPESQEVTLVAWDELPWNDLAYPNVAWALRQHRAMRGRANFAPLGVPDDDDPLT